MPWEKQPAGVVLSSNKISWLSVDKALPRTETNAVSPGPDHNAVEVPCPYDQLACLCEKKVLFVKFSKVAIALKQCSASR